MSNCVAITMLQFDRRDESVITQRESDFLVKSEYLPFIRIYSNVKQSRREYMCFLIGRSSVLDLCVGIMVLETSESFSSLFTVTENSDSDVTFALCIFQSPVTITME